MDNRIVLLSRHPPVFLSSWSFSFLPPTTGVPQFFPPFHKFPPPPPPTAVAPPPARSLDVYVPLSEKFCSSWPQRTFFSSLLSVCSVFDRVKTLVRTLFPPPPFPFRVFG